MKWSGLIRNIRQPERSIELIYVVPASHFSNIRWVKGLAFKYHSHMGKSSHTHAHKNKNCDMFKVV